MSRPRKLVPALLHHKATRHAKVGIGGWDVYLGKWNSKEAHEGYARFCAELAVAGSPAPNRSSKSVKRTTGPTVAEVLRALHAWAKGHYVKNGRPTGVLFAYRAPIKAARTLYESTLAAEFGPSPLEAVRAELSNPSVHKGHGASRFIVRGQPIVRQVLGKPIEILAGL